MRTRLLPIALALAFPSVTRAGGFDIPDVGTEALGRGGAFAAKADTPLALYYNVAGLAGQKGTHALVDVDFTYSDMAFTRAGAYSGDPSNPQTPYGGLPYPTVHNGTPLGYQPFIGVTSDLGGRLGGLTLGIGVYAPPGIGMRQYGQRREYQVAQTTKNSDGTTSTADHTAARYEVDVPTRDGGNWGPAPSVRAPSPARYDIAATDLTILMPTLAAGLNVGEFLKMPMLKWLDVGAAFQLVVGEFKLVNANLNPLGKSTCGAAGDNPVCDSYGDVATRSLTAAFLFSAMAHPTSWIDVGATVRPEIDIASSGTITPAADASSGNQIAPFPATFSIKLPTIVRAGLRAVSRRADGSERGDVELDATWENWSVEKAAHVHSDAFPLGDGTLDVLVPHNYHDVLSVRAGGAVNHPIGRGRLTLRAGLFYETPTTDVQDTHLDAFTTEKLGVTLGVGIGVGAVTFNLAYAGVWMPSRTVDNGSLRAVSGTNGTNWVDGIDPKLIVNNGRYDSSLQMFGAGMTIAFDEGKR